MVESGGRVEVPLQLALQVCWDGDAERRRGGQRVRLPAHRLRPGRHPGAGPAGRHPGLSGHRPQLHRGQDQLRPRLRTGQARGTRRTNGHQWRGLCSYQASIIEHKLSLKL